MFPAISEDARRVLLAEVLPAGALGQGEGVVFVPGRLLQQRGADLAPGGSGPIPVEPLGPAGGGGDHSVDDHVARPGVEGVDGLRPRAGGEDGHAADAADVLEQDRLASAAEAVIRIDANQAWTPRQAVRLLEEMQAQGLHIELVEQPVKGRDLDGLQFVTAHSPVPVMADESVFSPQDAMTIL